jgi:hypothetical protein
VAARRPLRPLSRARLSRPDRLDGGGTALAPPGSTPAANHLVIGVS